MRSGRTIVADLLLAGLMLGGGMALRAQNPEGDLAGTVRDSSGARVPGAKIDVRSLATGFERGSATNAEGEFRLDYLEPGMYRVTVSAPGFARAVSEVNVAVDSTREITVTLAPEELRQRVRVAGEASSIATQPLNTSSATLEGVVTSFDLKTIPLAMRSFANIAYLVPGTEPVEPSDPTKARITAVSFGGSSGLNDVLTVDGVDNSDDYIGGFLENISPDDIQEFAVSTADEDADTGRTTGGSVVITTKRGTNQWRGDAAFYERAAALNARFPIDNPPPEPKQPFSRQNYIGTLGGPIRKNRLWFFSSLESVPENASIAYSASSLQQFNALAALASEGLIPGVRAISVPSSVSVPFRDLMASTRLDGAESSRAQWFLRVSADNYTTRNDLVEQATLPSTGVASHSSYWNAAFNQEYIISPTWLDSLTLGASTLHLTERRNSHLGFALAFPFSSTSETTSGFETLGDNQFVTPIAAFPVLRNQEKYELRDDVSHVSGRHDTRFGVDLIHEPVLSGALSGTAERLTVFALDPTNYLNDPEQFSVDLSCAPTASLTVTPGTTCSATPASDGSFSQNVQRLGLYVEDTWAVAPRWTLNFGARYDTTFGLFTASGRSQLANPALQTLEALDIPLAHSAPKDYRGALAPRLGIVYALGRSRRTVIRAGFGLFYNDLSQNGWVTAFQAVNTEHPACTTLGAAGCLPGASAGGSGSIIDPHYKTPYAIHATAGIEHSLNRHWMMSADFVHEEGNHAYARYQYEAGYTLFSPLFPKNRADQSGPVPNITVFRSDNRSRYDALMVHVQGHVARRFDLIANYTLASAKTWGCVLGELFDYVDGVCNPLDAFGPGDFGPSGEDVRDRGVIAGVFYLPAGFEVSWLGQAETARPFTLTTPVDVNGLGDTMDDRAVVNGVQTTLDEFRGTPYIQMDARVARPFALGEQVAVSPFVEFFNLFNRNNPGANYVTDLAALPTPVNNLYNATALCENAACTKTSPLTSFKPLLVPAGALGDFFGPGTTVGIPFAAQIGARVTF